MWRQLVAVLLLVALFMSGANTAYSFGYLGFSGFANQSDVQQILTNNLEEQIARVTTRQCEARKADNIAAFELAGKQLMEYKNQYFKLTKRTYSPTCSELLIGF